MLSSQLKLSLSYYSDLYDMIVPKDHILRKIRELVDFSFIYDELKNKYCLDNGRNAKNPILLFKYLLLKYLYNLSAFRGSPVLTAVSSFPETEASLFPNP